MRAYISAVRPGLVLALGLSGCMSAPGRPGPAPEVPRPEQVQDFATLYGRNCAACHGSNDQPGPSIPLANPVYLSIIGRENLQRITANGIPGTLMPGFESSSGGMLTSHQVEVIVDGMLKSWGAQVLPPDSPSGAPPYAATLKGDPKQGSHSYATYCARCHGVEGRGSSNGASECGSIVDPSYLSLISDQGLRSYVLAGRPSKTMSESMPDYRGDLPGRSMTDQDVTDVVAWLSSQRPAVNGPDRNRLATPSR